MSFCCAAIKWLKNVLIAFVEQAILTLINHLSKCENVLDGSLTYYYYYYFICHVTRILFIILLLIRPIIIIIIIITIIIDTILYNLKL